MSVLSTKAILPTHTGSVHQEDPPGLLQNKQWHATPWGLHSRSSRCLMVHVELGQSLLWQLTGLVAPLCWPAPPPSCAECPNPLLAHPWCLLSSLMFLNQAGSQATLPEYAPWVHLALHQRSGVPGRPMWGFSAMNGVSYISMVV